MEECKNPLMEQSTALNPIELQNSGLYGDMEKEESHISLCMLVYLLGEDREIRGMCSIISEAV